MSIPTHLLIENIAIPYYTDKTSTHHVQIDDCVKNPSGREGPDEHDGGASGRSGGQVEGTQDQERQDVLQVVEVGPPDPLHVRVVELHLSLAGLRVFWVGEYLGSTDGRGRYEDEYPTILDERFETDPSGDSEAFMHVSAVGSLARHT